MRPVAAPTSGPPRRCQAFQVERHYSADRRAASVALEWPEVRLLTRLGGGERRANRPPGKLVLTRGVRRRLDLFAAQAILEAEVQRHGELPPRLASLLGRATSG